MDKQLITGRFTKAIGTYTQEACMQQQIAGKMVGLLEEHLPASRFKRVVEFGCGTGCYTRLLVHSLQPEHLLLNDICEEMRTCFDDLLSERVSFLPGDAEAISFPEETELITSCSTLQWFDSPETFFHRCNSSLSRGGYFAFTTFGCENMKEIHTLTGNGLAYRSLQQLNTSLAPMYDIIHSEEEVIPLHFDAPMEVLYHLKKTGVTGNSRSRWTRKTLEEFCEGYTRLFGREGGVPLTYHPIYIIAKKKEQ